MIITENFDTDTSSKWLIYNNAGTRSVVSNQLIYDNSSNVHGILISPYLLSNDFTLTVQLKLLTDYTGQQRGGIWLIDKNKSNAMQFYFETDHAGSIYATNIKTNGGIPSYSNWINTPINPTFNNGKIFTMKIVKNGNNIGYFLDDVLMRNMSSIADIKYFAFFAHGSKVAFDNIVCNVTGIKGNSKQDDGVASRLVLINDWQTGDFIAKITPQANGDFEYLTPNANKLIVSHIGAEGFAARIDAPITP